MAPTPASFPEAPFHSLRTPLRSEAEEAVDNLVQTANSRRQAILDELGLIRRDEREGQRALIAIQRETLVQAESTIRLLHQQIRLIESRLGLPSPVVSPSNLLLSSADSASATGSSSALAPSNNLVFPLSSSPSSSASLLGPLSTLSVHAGTPLSTLNPTLDVSFPPSYTSLNASQRLQALAASLTVTQRSAREAVEEEARAATERERRARRDRRRRRRMQEELDSEFDEEAEEDDQGEEEEERDDDHEEEEMDDLDRMDKLMREARKHYTPAQQNQIWSLQLANGERDANGIRISKRRQLAAKLDRLNGD